MIKKFIVDIVSGKRKLSTLSMVLTDNPELLFEAIQKVSNSSNHNYFQSKKFKGRFYILSHWEDVNLFNQFMEKPLTETFLSPILMYLKTDPFMNHFKLEKIFELHKNDKSPYYKLSKSTVENIDFFLDGYSKKYTEQTFKNEKANSIELFSDYRIKETITFLSGWDSIEEIRSWQKDNPPNQVFEDSSTGLKYSPDEYDILEIITK